MNRILVEDAARAIVAGAARPEAEGVFNTVDDDPAKLETRPTIWKHASLD